MIDLTNNYKIINHTLFKPSPIARAPIIMASTVVAFKCLPMRTCTVVPVAIAVIMTEAVMRTEETQYELQC